jgi:hypothetical protein
VKDSIQKSFTFKNTSLNKIIDGKLTIREQSRLTHDETTIKLVDIHLPAGASQEVSYIIGSTDQSTKIGYEFKFAEGGDKLSFEDEVPYILTPKPMPYPKINGAAVYGERANRPFQYAVAATGDRPMLFTATGLPEGLFLDAQTGIIKGSVASKGEYKVLLNVQNAKGKAGKEVKFVIGDQIALTPPMGWNSWNAWGLSVDQNKVIASARVYREKGLMNHGWTYINIDDGWEIVGNSSLPKRDSLGNIIVNEKFPDMKALGDSIHALGLKFGIYSSPGPLTCGGYTASYQHEINDAGSYASWGIDYLKYDWCSYDNIAKDHTVPSLQTPYKVMRKALDDVDRDIVFSLCQYGMGKVWEWGADVGGNLWRTTGDINDSWESMSTIGFHQVENANYAGPGHWNDPDMLVVGWVGWGPSLHPSGLTPDEQYTHISLWCMLSAPLLIGCDLTRLDEFTLNLLTNDEVLALDQDPLGMQAKPVIKTDAIQVWVKGLEDGTKAIGIFNTSEDTKEFTLDMSRIGLNGSVTLRDLWRQKNLGAFENSFKATIPSHGVVLVKAGRE